MATGSKFDAISTETRNAAAALAKLSWRPIACWGSIKLHRAADDTHTVAKVEVFHAMLATRDLYLVTESYDGRVELATICDNHFEAARLFAFHVRMIDPMGLDRHVGGTKAYKTLEASKGTFTGDIRTARKAHQRSEVELRRRVLEALLLIARQQSTVVPIVGTWKRGWMPTWHPSVDVRLPAFLMWLATSAWQQLCWGCLRWNCCEHWSRLTR
jgi:hypothetical protein